MNYQYFEKCIKENITLDQKEFSIFSKLPVHQKEQLLKIACIHEQIHTAQGFYRHISGREGLIGDILGEIICKHPQKSKEIVEWLLSFKNMPTNIENDFRQIMNKQNPTIWELVFSNIPFSEKEVIKGKVELITKQMGRKTFVVSNPTVKAVANETIVTSGIWDIRIY